MKDKCTPGEQRRLTRWEHEAVLDDMQPGYRAFHFLQFVEGYRLQKEIVFKMRACSSEKLISIFSNFRTSRPANEMLHFS